MLNQFDNVPKNLEILAEECAEVIQIKSKIVRFGFNDYHPKNGMPNRDALEQELGDILAMITILVNNGVLTTEGLEKAKVLKLEKLPSWYNQVNPDIHVCKCHI